MTYQYRAMQRLQCIREETYNCFLIDEALKVTIYTPCHVNVARSLACLPDQVQRMRLVKGLFRGRQHR